jgi:hypothetical protein
MELTHAQKLEILRKGYVKIPGVVPPVMVRRALQAINHSVGEGMNKDEMPILRAQSYCPEITGTPVIADLINATPAWSLAESAIGKGKIKPVGGGQIGLRFPSLQDPPRKPSPHLDGMYSPTNGVRPGTIQNFTMLVAVFLSDVPEPYSGNFTVWPGTHRLYETYFREHGPESLLEGMPKVALPEPEQITARAGDVVLCHYQIAHCAGPNVSPHVRYGIFFRLSHVDHSEQKLEVMKNIWLEWDGMRDLLPENG